MAYFKDLPERADLWDVIRLREDLWGFILEAGERIMRAAGPLGRAERELIGTYVSSLNACDYCADAHAAKAKALGLGEVAAALLLDDPAAAPVDPRLTPLFVLARKLTLTPDKVVEADLRALAAAGWDADAASAAIAVVAWFNFLNRVVLAHGCVLRDDILALAPPAGEQSPSEAYAAYLESLRKKDERA